MTDFLGQQLGNYRLIRLLGQGGFADVYLGEHIFLGTYAAVKVLNTQVAVDDVERFLKEARIIANLKNPQHIVPVLDFGVENRTPFLVMEHAANGTLRQRHPRGSTVPLNTIVSYVEQVAVALQYAHDRKLAHRDVKPENILLGPDNQVWLSDFGLALIIESNRASIKEMAGTYLYMAPEQIKGDPCPASDQYALGIVVYEWLCGSPPFQGTFMELPMLHMHAPPPSLCQRVPGLAPAIEEVVFRALAKDPKQRFARVKDFAKELERVFEENPTIGPQPVSKAAPVGPSEPTVPGLAAASVPPIEAALVGPSGRTVLGPTILTIGRALDNQLVLNDPQVSKYHAKVRPQGPGYAIIDLASFNHTFVNEQPLSPNMPRLLNAGDVIRLGTTTQMAYEAKRKGQFEDVGGFVLKSPSPVPSPPVSPIPPGPQLWLTLKQLLLIGLALLIIVAGTGLFFVMRNIQNQTFTNNATATAQANSDAAATAQANATATARANNTATAVAQATATATFVANPYPPSTGTLALFDPLRDNSKGLEWDEPTQGTIRCQFIGGSYHTIDSTSQYYDFCFANASNFSNFAYQVEMKILNGDCGGLLFRADSAQSNTYIFEVCQDSRYRLLIHSSNPVKDRFLLGFYTNAVIKGGYNQTNVIAVVAKGNTIQMYVNKVLVDSISDNTHSQGQIGLLADAYNGPTEVAYANAKVWTL